MKNNTYKILCGSSLADLETKINKAGETQQIKIVGNVTQATNLTDAKIYLQAIVIVATNCPGITA